MGFSAMMGSQILGIDEADHNIDLLKSVKARVTNQQSIHIEVTRTDANGHPLEQ